MARSARAARGAGREGGRGRPDCGYLAAGRLRRAAAACLALAGLVQPAAAQTVEDLRNLSIEDLAKVEVTSVSGRAEALSEAPAAVYVIRNEDIRRSGATSLAEALRLAPNLEVARVNSQQYSISARGFNSVNAANKLLVLIDGRSVYTPFFSSVFWDQQQVMLDDIDRIEVISGPGSTLYGANAVNGVINVITKSSADTQGGLIDLKYGNFDKAGAGRWGGKLGDIGTYRGYALGFGRGSTELRPGTSADDDWNGKQAGFRTDFSLAQSAFTFQGDAFENLVDVPGSRLNGGNLLGRWTKRLADGSSVQVQSYYDRQDRSSPGVVSKTNTFDIQAQHDFRPAPAHEIVWGVGQRVYRDSFMNTLNIFVLEPQSETLTLTDLFGQDTITLQPDLKLTLGTKFEYNSFSGFEYLPSARLGWQATPADFLWAAVSRAVRTPSRLDRELQAPGLLAPAPDFRSEKLIAYEAGYRAQPLPEATLSFSLFYNQYDDLRTTSLRPGGPVGPIVLANGMTGETYGFEAWGDYSIRSWWRLSPGFTLLRKRLHLKDGANDISGIQTSAGQDPGHQAFLRSTFALPHDVDLYVGLRQIGSLGGASVPAYFEADVRVGWRVTPAIELSLAGLNLVHAHHAETYAPPIEEIPRSVYAGLRFRF